VPNVEFVCDKQCIGEVDQMVMHVLFVAHDYRRNSVIDFIVEAVEWVCE
jgi:hypothetical protein